MARNAKNTRMCAGCRMRSDKSQLVRIYRLNDYISIADSSSHTGGRGVYICRCADCLDKAIKRKSFSRSLGCEMPPELYNRIENYVKSLNQE